jgi:hypothetical protein
MLRFMVGCDPWFLAFGLVLDCEDSAISLHVGPFFATLWWEAVDAD